MNEIVTTLTGNLATDPRHVETDAGLHITTFRVAATERKRDGRTWVDGETSYVTVTCWRWLAQNAAASLRKGDPVFVSGSMRVRQWEKDGRSGHTTEIDARVIGHDLNRGLSSFERVVRARPVSAEEEARVRLSAGLDAGAGTAEGLAAAEAAGVDAGAPAGVDVRTGEIYAEEDAA